MRKSGDICTSTTLTASFSSSGSPVSPRIRISAKAWRISSPARSWRWEGPAEPLVGRISARLVQLALDFLHAEAFDHVADAHVLVAFERHAAFLADLHFFHFILEALESRERA